MKDQTNKLVHIGSLLQPACITSTQDRMIPQSITIIIRHTSLMTSDIDVYVNNRAYGSYNAILHHQLLY